MWKKVYNLIDEWNTIRFISKSSDSEEGNGLIYSFKFEIKFRMQWFPNYFF
jgi:hypothetical protein